MSQENSQGEVSVLVKGGPLDAAEERVARVRWWIISGLQAVMTLGLLLALWERHWFDALVIVGILLIMSGPLALSRTFKITIPAEFELMAVIFVYASLFLGEVRGYYTRFWWWDLALHSMSGLLLGIFGFLLVYLLNEDDRVDLRMRPRFVALFAFLFAVASGALWEVFEFMMDQLAGMNMQKPMLGDPSGLTDTMWDMIVNAVGAFVISFVGWWYMKADRRSFIDILIHKFIAYNAHLFRRGR